LFPRIAGHAIKKMLILTWAEGVCCF
jgi:hypothetical protein